MAVLSGKSSEVSGLLILIVVMFMLTWNLLPSIELTILGALWLVVLVLLMLIF